MRAGRCPCTVFLPFLLAFVVAASVQASSENVTANISIGKFGQMPVAFTENQGQWDERVKFRASANGATIWFTTDGVYYQFSRRIRQDGLTSDDPLQMPHEGSVHKQDSVEQLVIKASFAGANPAAGVVGEGLIEYKCNYFIGNDPSKWHTDVPNYSSVLYNEIYPGIDIRFSGAGDGKAGYEFIAAPGADLAQVELEYEGIDELSISADGRLTVSTAWGEIAAATGSKADGGPTASRCLLLTSEHTAGFDAGATESLQPTSLTLSLEYGTYLGGSDLEWGYSIAVDGSGAAYVTGVTGSTDFPTVGSYQGTFQGEVDVFVTKLSSTGNSAVYSTYLGGSGTDWGGYEGPSIAVDGSGAAYVTGTTESTDFPTVNPYQTHQGLEDVFVTKLSNSGNSLVYSTYLGGENPDQSFCIAVDGSGSAYVTGKTASSYFPTVNPYQTYQGVWDAFVTKFSSSGNNLVYSTYLGGTGGDIAYAIAVDGFGCAYVVGYTEAADFPTVNPYQGTIQGVLDAFVTKLSSSGSSLAYSTYLGGSGYDKGVDVAVYWDNYGNPPGYVAFAAGLTESTDFPTFSPYQSHQGNLDVFVTRLSKSGSSLTYSTYLGGSNVEEAEALAVDGSGCAYLTGLTGSIDFPTVDQCQGDQESDDAFVAKLSSGGNTLRYSTYLGGNGGDHAYDIAVDATGSAYVTGKTSSTNFPTISPYQGTFQGGTGDGFVAKLSLVEFVCGDADDSGMVDIDDVVYLIAYIFSGGPEPMPYESGDADCSGAVDIDDVVYLIAYIFSGGPEPCDPDGDGVPDC